MRKVIGIIIVGMGILIGYLAINHFAPYHSDVDSVRLQKLWEDDLESLAKAYPDAFLNVVTTKIVASEGEAAKMMQSLNYPGPTNTEGDYALEILFDIWVDGDEEGALFQYDFTDANGNTIFEISRTIKF
ncbi:MAG: hypothetical protein KDD25_05040 [Bdellovibrionales bacterium]|nr:hypothetical protein [Bdellovibrionales bacterium]